jgi:hypothetical protein
MRIRKKGRTTYGSRHNRQVKNIVNRLLYCLFVLWNRGTGLMPFSSAPASRNLWYHFECFSGLASYTSPSLILSSETRPPECGLRSLLVVSACFSTSWVEVRFPSWEDSDDATIMDSL